LTIKGRREMGKENMWLRLKLRSTEVKNKSTKKEHDNDKEEDDADDETKSVLSHCELT